MSVSVLLYLLLLLIAAFVGGSLFKAIKQPPVVGYLVAGLVLGIVFGDVGTRGEIEFLSELGVVLLLFTLGLEFSLNRLKKVARVAIFGGILQIMSTILFGTFFIRQFGFDFYSSLFMAAAFSLSSTAVVVKLLTDRGEMDTLPGEILIAWLIIQDLAVLPMMILLPTLGKELAVGNVTTAGLLSLGQNVAFVAAILVGLVLLGREVVPRVISKVAALNSRELLLLTVFGVAVAGGLATQLMGLSAAIGAFLAGLLIAESAHEHAVFTEIRPLRDLFALLFFTTLGLILPGGFLFTHFGQIVGIVGLIMLVKLIIVVILTLYLGYHAKTSLLVGVGLVEVGEFAFILARVGLAEKVVSLDVYSLILSVTLVSILFLPPLFTLAPRLYLYARNASKKHFPPLYLRLFAHLEHKDTLEELPFADHVVLCGYGRVGRYIGRALTMAKIPFIVIEYNHHKARELKEEGIPVVYGDPADVDILDFAQVDHARAVVIAIPDLHTQEMVITGSKQLNKKIQIFCRTHHEDHQKILKALGAENIIQPEFEAALSITQKILKNFGTKEGEIEGKLSRLKLEHGLG